MNVDFKEQFLEKWQKYFSGNELPIVFWYGDEDEGYEKFIPPGGRSCMICELKLVRKGQSLVYDRDNITCRGARRYTGYTNRLFPDFRYFLFDFSF